MKKLIKYMAKGIGIILCLILVVFFTGLLWPMPELPKSTQHGSILIRSINIVDVKTGDLHSSKDIIIKDNRIQQIGDSLDMTESDYDLVIDGRGKFTIPGLWDMHTHSSPYSPWLHHPMYIANGVTGIRDMSGQLDRDDPFWAGSRQRLKWNSELENGTRISPRHVLQSSFQINGSNSVPDGFPDYFKVNTEEDALKLLEYYKDEGADFIKVYSEIPAPAYRKLSQQASLYGLHIAGHKPLNVTLEEAIKLDQRSFEHGRIFMFDCFPQALELREAKNKRAQYKKSKPLMVKNFDNEKAEYLMDLMREHKTHWTPTLQTLKISTYRDIQEMKTNPDLRYVLSTRKALWWNPLLGRDGKKQSDEQHELNVAFYSAVKEQVSRAADKGVTIMTGTDVTDTNVIPGISLHTELADLVEAGLTNLQALQSATITPARYCHLESDYGSVDTGKMADMIILTNNPLEKIENTTAIEAVLVGGTYYNIYQLNQLKDETASVVSSFHMNIKFIYSLFASPLMRKQLAD